MAKRYSVICDIDQTLFFWKTRDRMLYPKLNKPLYELLKGREDVLFCTARGKGTRGFNARPTIDQAMQIIAEVKTAANYNDIEHLDLNVDKPYGEVYIDDKAITPEHYVMCDGSFMAMHRFYKSNIFKWAWKLWNFFLPKAL